MALEVSISEVVQVDELLGELFRSLRRLVTWLATDDESADLPDVTEDEDNKSPPDLGISVTDETNTGESMGP